MATTDLISSLKPNSHAYKAGQQEVAGPVKRVQRRDVQVTINRNPWKRFWRTLFVDDATTIKEYTIRDVLFPTIRNLLWDSMTGMLSIALYGSPTRGGGRRKENNNERVSYAAYYKSGGDSHRRNDVADRDTRDDYRDLTFTTRTDAEAVLADLYDLTQEYQAATVGDLLDIVGKTGEFTDQKWGWTNLDSATVRQTRDGYILDLPKPRSLV